jgi:hypothetical protein
MNDGVDTPARFAHGGDFRNIAAHHADAHRLQLVL